MKFYADVFDWKFEDYTQFLNSLYFVIFTQEEGTPGINGGIQLRPADRPSLEMGTNADTLTMGVDDYDLFEQKILMAGGQVALPKIALNGMACQGYYLDTEGNVFGIHQPYQSSGL